MKCNQKSDGKCRRFILSVGVFFFSFTITPSRSHLHTTQRRRCLTRIRRECRHNTFSFLNFFPIIIICFFSILTRNLFIPQSEEKTLSPFDQLYQARARQMTCYDKTKKKYRFRFFAVSHFVCVPFTFAISLHLFFLFCLFVCAFDLKIAMRRRCMWLLRT